MTRADAVAFVGLGSNLGNPRTQLCDAIESLDALPGSRVDARSSFYVNPPMGPPDQPDYINAVVRMRTSLSARELLDGLQRIERGQGRVRGGQRWGPRTIDLDLLLFGEQTIDLPGLKVPHPGMAERAFVLLPLAELAPELEIPGLGTVRALLEGIDTSSLRRLKPDPAHTH